MNRLLKTALSYYGLTEHSGSKHNPTILGFFKLVGHSWVTTDETAWCSAGLGAMAIMCKLEGSKALNARSWLDYGKHIKKPRVGDVVVLWRESATSWKGHVGIFISFSEDGKYINILGGNQSNKVCIAAYPASRLLGFRRLKRIKRVTK